LNIHGRDRTVHLITYGGGHTPSDAFVYLPDDKLAVMGDLVLSNHHPVLFNANPKEWINILNQVDLLHIEKIIPGHGEVLLNKRASRSKRLPAKYNGISQRCHPK
jgi:cyclase